MKSIYLCIDLKTFFASVECVERGLDPFTTNLVVADPSRGKGAICLAVSPALKALGVRNRCRIYEIPDEISYITALPRMNLYMRYSADIYGIYLKYIAKEDIHIYSIDEVFMDVSAYLKLYHLNAKQLANKILADVFEHTGITATVGIGTNLYLAKIALDISAKKAKDHMAFLNEQLYQKTLWHHRPLTDFWMIGKGISARLERYHLLDMYDIAHCEETLLYREFGINAKYLIDHAKGIEPTTIADIKQYQPNHHSFSNSQILFEDYQVEEALLVLKEMVELNCLELSDRNLVCNHISLYIGYSNHAIASLHVSKTLEFTTNSYRLLVNEFIDLYQKNINSLYPIRQIRISFDNVVDEQYEAYDLFIDRMEIEEEKALQHTLVEIKHKFGKNAILKGMNLMPKATTPKRNRLVGGHNAE